jgi:hypothetical protein
MPTRGLKQINGRIEYSVSTVKQLQQNATWLKLAETVFSFPALKLLDCLIWELVGGLRCI